MISMPEVGDKTIAQQLAELTVTHPSFVFIKFGTADYTIQDINQRAEELARALLAAGLTKGQRVAIMLPSHPDHIVSILALAKIGLVRVSVNIQLKGAALAHAFDTFKPEAIIHSDQFIDKLSPLASFTSLKKFVWSNQGAPTLRYEGRDISAIVKQNAHSYPLPSPLPDDILAITPSSGTTGPPKGVLKSDRTLRAGALGILRLNKAKAGDSFVLWESLHHGAGVAVVLAALHARITLVIVEKFSASRLWRQLKANNAKHLHYLGSVLAMLYKQAPSGEDKAHGVQIAWGGGCPPSIWRGFEERFGVKIHEGYGLSELTTLVTANLAGREGSIGEPLDYFEVQLTNEDGTEVSIGEIGEITVQPKDPRLGFLGYFENLTATQQSLRNGWFLTGDLAWADSDGYLYYAGRKKDSVRRRGINISAWEVEHVVAEHPAIEECAMVGVPSELGENELKIFLRLKPSSQLTPGEFIAWCEKVLPPFQVPRYVEYVEDFPRTPTQRIKKGELSLSVAGCWDFLDKQSQQ